MRVHCSPWCRPAIISRSCKLTLSLSAPILRVVAMIQATRAPCCNATQERRLEKNLHSSPSPGVKVPVLRDTAPFSTATVGVAWPHACCTAGEHVLWHHRQLFILATFSLRSTSFQRNTSHRLAACFFRSRRIKHITSNLLNCC